VRLLLKSRCRISNTSGANIGNFVVDIFYDPSVTDELTLRLLDWPDWYLLTHGKTTCELSWHESGDQGMSRYDRCCSRDRQWQGPVR
jgi:hypothetical protein